MQLCYLGRGLVAIRYEDSELEAAFCFKNKIWQSRNVL